ncbi:MAG TPA: hypothetical protein VI248_04365 [Kineosporiaceae bacterium]
MSGVDRKSRLDLGDLRDFLDRVVMPVARGILTEEEFEDAWVSLEPDAFQPDNSVVWVRVLAAGEAWAHAIWIPGQEDDTYVGLAARIADSLQDWIAESGFGWGQLRVAQYRID